MAYDGEWKSGIMVGMELPNRPPTTDDEAERLIRQHPNPHFAEALIEMYGRLRRSLPVVNAWLEIAAAIRKMDENPPTLLSQLITRLQELQAEHGDVPAYVTDEGGYRCRPDIVFEVITLGRGFSTTVYTAGPGIEIFPDYD